MPFEKKHGVAGTGFLNLVTWLGAAPVRFYFMVEAGFRKGFENYGRLLSVAVAAGQVRT
jgi:hypothetical protein